MRITERYADDGLQASMEAEKHWRKLNKHELILKVLEGAIFEDGILKVA